MPIDNKLKEDAVGYSVDTINYICQNIPPREAGSSAEKAAQEYLAKELIDSRWADTAVLQPFTVSPKAFMGFSRIIPVLIALGIILFYWLPWAPIAAGVLSLVVLVFEFILYWRFLDPFYPKSTSHNLIATKKPEGEVKRRIIFSGHIDAAYEWTIFYKFGKGVYLGGIVSAIIGLITGIVISAISITYTRASFEANFLWMIIVMAIFTPGYLSLFLYSNFNRVVPGANDNLTGCLTAVSVLKYLKEAKISFANTEVVCLITGSEEAGLRGAKAFTKEYSDYLKEVETVFVGLETFRDSEHMSIFAKDLSGTVKNDPKAVALLDKAAALHFENPLPHASVFLGATDGAAFTQAGIPACTLGAMDPAPANYYHTRRDTPDNLNPQCIGNAISIAVSSVEVFDKQGL
ncbi:MAG: M20/M25/M40 family metallo-hydrolase [Clostridia bacterium]